MKMGSVTAWKKFSSATEKAIVMNKRLLKRLFLNNWIPKIASLLAAIALWFLINGYQKNDAVMGDPVGENRN